MLFNDYVVRVNNKSSQLEKLSNIVDDLNEILEYESQLFKVFFEYSYLGLINLDHIDIIENCNHMTDSAKLYMSKLTKSLIEIDFVEFGMVLLEFKSIPDEFEYFDSQYIFDEFMNSYKIIHKFKTLIDKDDIYKSYSECMGAIRNIVNLYNNYLYKSTYINDVNKKLSKITSVSG